MIQSSLTLSLSSVEANRLFNGGANTKEFIPNFYYANKRVNSLYKKAVKDNPFAHAALVLLDSHINTSLKLSRRFNNESQDLLDSSKNDGISISILSNSNPSLEKIDCVCEYSTVLATTLSQIDKTVMYIRTCATANLMTKQYALDALRSLNKSYRRSLDHVCAMDKRIFDCTRIDVINGIDSVQPLIKQFGHPVPGIMSGDIQFQHTRLPVAS